MNNTNHPLPPPKPTPTPIPPDNPPIDINAYLLPFVIIIGLCISVLFCFMVLQIIRCIRSHRRGNKHRLGKKYLKQIPITKYHKGDQFDTCAICLDEYTEDEKLRVLPCGHLYHMKCIDPWLTKNRKVCPVCKGKVILPGMSDDSDSDLEGDGHEDSANERTPLIPNNSSIPEASTSTRRVTIYSENLSTRLGLDRSTQVNPSSRNASILTSSEADVTPITLAPQHSVNYEIDESSISTERLIFKQSRRYLNILLRESIGSRSTDTSHNGGANGGTNHNSITIASSSSSSSSSSPSTGNHNIII